MESKPIESKNGIRPSSVHMMPGFMTTRWSLVLRASGRCENSREALEKLCAAYWPPVYTWVRRDGHSHESAQDLTQEFFARLLGYESLARATPEKGRFRSFLLGALKHFLINEWQHANRQKRGGGRLPFSLDAMETFQREALEPRDDDSPDRLFERRWAETLLARANQRLRREYEAANQSARFEALKVYLLDGGEPNSYAEAAAKLGLSSAAVKSAIYKLRQRYGEMVRHEVAQTVGDPAEVEDELRCLLAALTT